MRYAHTFLNHSDYLTTFCGLSVYFVKVARASTYNIFGMDAWLSKLSPFVQVIVKILVKAVR